MVLHQRQCVVVKNPSATGRFQIKPHFSIINFPKTNSIRKQKKITNSNYINNWSFEHITFNSTFSFRANRLFSYRSFLQKHLHEQVSDWTKRTTRYSKRSFLLCFQAAYTHRQEYIQPNRSAVDEQLKPRLEDCFRPRLQVSIIGVRGVCVSDASRSYSKGYSAGLTREYEQ